MKIKNIDDLRDDALETLFKLQKKEISIEEAGITSKLYENIMSSVKLQVEVAKMLHREPNIPFLGDSSKGKLISIKKLTHNSSK